MKKTPKYLRMNTAFSALILIFSVSLVLGYQYIHQIDIPNFQLRLDLHQQIIRATAPSPYRYRVLVPFIVESLTKLFSINFSAEKAFLLAYGFYDWISILLTLTSLFLWLRIWFENEPALIGVLFVASSMSIAFQDHYFQPWSLLEPALFSLSLLAMYKQNFRLLAILVVLASLNRETAIFIPLTFLTTIRGKNNQTGQAILRLGILLLIWAITFLGLRFLRGNAPHVETIESLLTQNFTPQNLFYTLSNSTLLLGGFWIFSIAGIKYAPPFIQRVSLIIPLYLLSVLIWGVWKEVRLLLPLYPFLLPLGLSFLYHPSEQL